MNGGHAIVIVLSVVAIGLGAFSLGRLTHHCPNAPKATITGSIGGVTAGAGTVQK